MSIGVAALATGCAPLVGVKRLSSRNANRAMTSNVLSTDDLSEPTRIALRRHNLIEQFDDKPEDAIAQLHRAVVSEGGDGVVKYVSAHIDGVESERVVNSPHSCQSNADTIDEVRRILRVHAADVDCGPQRPSGASASGGPARP